MKRNDEMAVDDVRQAESSEVAEAPTRRPVMRLARRAEASEVTIELPGVSTEDVELLAEGRRLVVRATPAPWAPDGGMRSVCDEIEGGSFEVTLEVPQAIAMERIEADLRDGLLVLSFPKRVLERRSIEVTGK